MSVREPDWGRAVITCDQRKTLLTGTPGAWLDTSFLGRDGLNAEELGVVTRESGRPPGPSKTASIPKERLVIIAGTQGLEINEIQEFVDLGATVLVAPTSEASRHWQSVTNPDAPSSAVDPLQIDLRGRTANWKGTPLQLTELKFKVLAALASEVGTAWPCCHSREPSATPREPSRP